MRTRILMVVLGLVTVVLSVVALSWLRRPAAMPAVGWRYRLPAGTTLTYDVIWRGEQSARMMENKNATGSVDVAAQLTLRSYGLRDGAWWVGARLDTFRKHSLTLLGKDVMADDTALHQAFDGHEALVELQPDGRVRSIGFSSRDGDLFKHVMQWLLTQLQLTVTDDKTWTAEEAGPFGLSTVRYVATADGLDRTRLAYSRLDAMPAGAAGKRTVDGKTHAVLLAEGVVSQLDLDETLDVENAVHASVHVSAHLAARGTHDAVSPPVADERRVPGQIVTSAALDERLLEQRVDGMTIEDLLADLRSFGEAADSPTMNAFIWRATGLLQLHPELAQKLVAPYGKAGNHEKGLILDLLVGGGNPQCQAVMRKLLDDAKARAQGSEAYVEHLQRLSLVEKPEAANAEMLSNWSRDASNRDVKLASAFALGSTVHHLADEDPSLAQKYNRELADQLRRADSAEDKAMLIRALGNAGLDENLPALLDASSSDDAGMRRASAAALRQADGDQAVQALIRLAGDPDVSTQAAALSSLDRHTLGPADLAALSQVVLSGATSELVDPILIGLLSTRLDGGAPVVEMLRYLAARSGDPRVRARIGALTGNQT